MIGRLWSWWIQSLPPRYRRLRERRPDLVDLSLVVVAWCLVWPLVDWWFRQGLGVPIPFYGWVDVQVLPFAFYDWEVYIDTIGAWQAGEPLYTRQETLGYHRGYLYPPLVLLLLYPFVVPFGEAAGAMLWALASVLLLWIGLQLLIAELGYSLRRWERGVLMLALVGYQPLLLTIKMGQLAGFLVGLLCLAFVAAERSGRPAADQAAGDGDEAAGDADEDVDLETDRRRWEYYSVRWAYYSGVLTGVVGFVKLSYAPVATHLLVDRRRLVGAVATGAVLVVASVGSFGLETHLTYLDVLEWGIRFGNDARPPEIARPTYFMPLNWIPGSLAVRIGASLLIAATVALSSNRSREAFVLGLAAFPLLVPTGYSYYLVAMVPAGIVMLAVELERDGRPIVPVLAVGLANAQVHGVRFLTGWLPEYLVILQVADPLYPLFQPGLWATLSLSVLAYARVRETVARPQWVTLVRSLVDR